ncbi:MULTISPECIES: YnhF family membrane protein [Aeromonas]|nr:MULTISPECIES: YnhF family membrane protein [Aeromonas]MCO4205519.1 YnhF family membrane protein [Aeromonas taiwanensis]
MKWALLAAAGALTVIMVICVASVGLA